MQLLVFLIVRKLERFIENLLYFPACLVYLSFKVFFLLFYLLFDITKPLFFCTLVSCNRAQPICHCANVGAAASLHSTVRDTGHTIAWIYVASESLLSGQDKPCPWAVECVMRRFNLPVVSRINSINFLKTLSILSYHQLYV